MSNLPAHRRAIVPHDNLDETLLFINGVYCPRPEDTDWCFSQEYSLNDIEAAVSQSKRGDTLGDVLDISRSTNMRLDLTRGDRHFTAVVSRVTSFRGPSGLKAINLEIDFDTRDPAKRELLNIRAARLALTEGKDAGG